MSKSKSQGTGQSKSQGKRSGCPENAFPIILQVGQYLSSLFRDLPEEKSQQAIGEAIESTSQSIDAFQEIFEETCPDEMKLLQDARKILQALHDTFTEANQSKQLPDLTPYIDSIHAFRRDVVDWASHNDLNVADVMSAMNFPDASTYTQLQNRLSFLQSKLSSSLKLPIAIFYS